MTPKNLATLLNGRTRNHEMTKAEAAEAKDNGLVVFYGYSNDDATIVKGAFTDYFGCWEGGTVNITKSGLPENKCSDGDCPYYGIEKNKGTEIKAVWSDDGDCCWTYETSVPHETFDVLDDDGNKFCKGIVFSASNIP